MAAISVRPKRYDAAVLDLGLPKRDGVSVLRDWRAEGRTLPCPHPDGARRLVRKGRGLQGRRGRLSHQALPDRGGGHALTRARPPGGGPCRRAHRMRRHCPSMPSSVQFELDGLPLKLTAFEWRVLSALMLRKEIVIERSDLIERVYEGDADVDSNSIEVIIGRLRRKIGP
jgi:two-component system OmpR family response regulator